MRRQKCILVGLLTLGLAGCAALPGAGETVGGLSLRIPMPLDSRAIGACPING